MMRSPLSVKTRVPLITPRGICYRECSALSCSSLLLFPFHYYMFHLFALDGFTNTSEWLYVGFELPHVSLPSCRVSISRGLLSDGAGGPVRSELVRTGDPWLISRGLLASNSMLMAFATNSSCYLLGLLLPWICAYLMLWKYSWPWCSSILLSLSASMRSMCTIPVIWLEPREQIDPIDGCGFAVVPRNTVGRNRWWSPRLMQTR